MIDDQRLVDLVVGLLTVHHLERPDTCFGIIGVAFNPIDFEDLAVVDLVGDGDLVNDAVVPLVLRTNVLRVFEIAFLGGVDQVAVIIADEQRFAIRAALSCGRPIPEHLGGDSAAREFRNMATLAGDAVGVVVEFSVLVRRFTMA